MKNARKDENGLFICEECGKAFKLKHSLSFHVNLYHDNKKYYDRWLKSREEGFCICGKETEYSYKWNKGYKKFCSDECFRIGLRIKYNNKSEEEKENIRIKRDKTNLAIFGVANPFSSEIIKEKIKQTNFKLLGVLYPGQSKIVKEKIKKQCLEHFGYENPQQDPDIFKKTQFTQLKYKKYGQTDLVYQGSYEFDFLEKFQGRIEIKNGPYIKYRYNNKNKVYHSDFYIPELNLVIEIKSLYYFEKYKEINLIKEKAIREKGYEYIIIIDKNYGEFENKFHKFFTMDK